MPKVSICIPTYNNLEAFERCLESVLMQNFQDYEVVITDDSSNNDIELYLHRHSHLKNIFYYKNSTALGSPENWNEAMRKATGDYIKILHHDDFFTYNHSLQIFVDLLDNNPESDFAFVASRNFDLKKNTVLSYNKPSSSKIEEIKKNPLILLNNNFIGAPSATIFRRLEYLSFDGNTIWFVDIDFYIQIITKNRSIKYNSTDAISVGGGDSRITEQVENNKEINIFEFFYLLNKWNLKKLKNSDFENSTYLLLKKFNIKSSKEIRSLNYKDSLPQDINRIFLKLYSEKVSNFLKRKLRKHRTINVSRKTESKDNSNTSFQNSTKGDNVLIGKNSTIVNSTIGENIKIGEDCYFYNVNYGDFSYNSIRVTLMNCTIGKFCSIAQGVSIGLGKHPINEFVSTHPAFYSPQKQCGYTFSDEQLFNEMGTITIGNDVWIGANAIIADDVKIGNGAVIAANSFINKDVPDFAIVAGTPGKIIRYRFNEDEIKFLLDLKWWDKDIDWLKTNHTLMLDIKTLMKKLNDHH